MSNTNTLATDSIANTEESPLTNSRTNKDPLSVWEGIINEFFGSEMSIILSNSWTAKTSFLESKLMAEVTSIAEAPLTNTQNPNEKPFMCNPRKPHNMLTIVVPLPRSSGKSSFLITNKELKNLIIKK